MIRSLAIAALLAAPLIADDAPAPADLLRFTNGNQLDGRFTGMDSSGVVTWTRPDVATPMPFQREKIRQIVLRSARPLSAIENPCHITLVNGDRIPGNVVAANDTEVTLETTSAGTLVLPRDTISVIAPNPFGGRLLYAGPFDDKGWTIVRPGQRLITPPGNEDPFADHPPPVEEEATEKDKPGWSHSGAAWYSRGTGDAVVMDVGMPDRAMIRFKLGWRSRPSISVAFHADLTHPEPKEDDKEKKALPQPNFGGMQSLSSLFGTAYILNFQSGYVHLQRSGYDDDGSSIGERIRGGSTSVRLQDTGEAIVEIRCDRQEGTITVHVDGEFAVQWNTSSDDPLRPVQDGPRPKDRKVSYLAPGGGLGFLVQGTGAPVRISDIVVAEWNGMTDSARSMDSDLRDIALLANGTDRFSGNVTAIRDGLLEIDAAYGPLKVPLTDVAEIRFAREKRREPGKELPAGITLHLQPVGRISGVPLEVKDGRVRLDSPLAGRIDMDLAPAVVLEFQSAGGFLDDWDESP